MKNKSIWIAAGVAAALCLCAGIVGFLVMREAGKKVSESMKTDPAQVAQAGAEIADYTLPKGYTHQMAMGFFGYEFVAIGPDDYNGMMIMLAQFSQNLTQGMDPETFEEQMRQSLEQQSGRRGMDMKVVESRKMVIRGQETSVVISEGTDANSGMAMRQLITIFPGKNGTAFVMIQGMVQEWDDKAVDEFIMSIH